MEERTKKVKWEEHKQNMMVELARLESMDWASDPKVAESIFPYVLVEAINILKNSEIVDNPKELAGSSEDVEKLLNSLISHKG